MKTLIISNIPDHLVDTLNDFIQQNITDGYFGDTLAANKIEYTQQDIDKIEITIHTGFNADTYATILNDFDEYFYIINEPTIDMIKQERNSVYALDLRDGTDFLIDESHDIQDLIDSKDFLFGTEK